MRNINPQFALEKQQRQVEKLGWILEAIKNCHSSLDTIDLEADIHYAQAELGSAFRRLAKIYKLKKAALPTLVTLPQMTETEVFDVEMEMICD
jgi:hypothetical protein